MGLSNVLVPKGLYLIPAPAAAVGPGGAPSYAVVTLRDVYLSTMSTIVKREMINNYSFVIFGTCRHDYFSCRPEQT